MNFTLIKIYIYLSLVFSLSFINADPTKNIFNKISPGIVLVDNLLTPGSGIVLNSKGLILTNYHLIKTLFPLRITAKVIQKNKRVIRTFTKVKVYRIHNVEDLALLKVKLPSDTKMLPLRLSSRLLKKGDKCYLIGREAKTRKNKITSGVITEKNLGLKENGFLQTNAKFNFGNSGGALVNEQGEIVGILSYVPTLEKWLGHAIPKTKFKREDFLKEKNLNFDTEQVLRWQKIGNRWFTRASNLLAGPREDALKTAFTAYQISLTINPNFSSTYQNIGSVYFELGKYAKAKVAFKKAIELKKGSKSNLYTLLAHCELGSNNNSEAAKNWRKAILSEGQDTFRSMAAEDLAILEVRQQNYLQAIYLIKWANFIKKASPSRQRVRNSIYQNSYEMLEQKDRNFISIKNSHFSFEELDSYTSKEGLTSSLYFIETDKQESDSFSKKEFEKVTANPLDPGPEGYLEKLPEKATDCRSAFGGAYLILRFPEMKRLGVFNIAQLKFETQIPIPDKDCIYACGGKTLLIYSPKKKFFLIYDLATFKLLAAKLSPLEEKILNIEMGLRVSNQAFISWSRGKRYHTSRHYGFLELPSMVVKEIKLPKKNSYIELFFSTSRMNIRFDPLLRNFVSWFSHSSHPHFMYGSLDGTQLTQYQSHQSYGVLSLMKGSKLVLTEKGKLLNFQGVELSKFTITSPRKCLYYPVEGANQVLRIESLKATLLNATNSTVIQNLKTPFKLKRFFLEKNNASHDRYAFASAYLKRAVFLNEEDSQQLFVCKIETDKKIESKPLPPKGTKTGELWSHKLKYPTGTKIVIEDAPQDVQLDQAKMLLTWKISLKTKPGTYIILLSIKEPKKEEEYQQIEVTTR